MAERKHSRSAGASEGEASEMIEKTQRRVTRALRSDKPEDVLIKAVFGSLAAALAVRLIRQTPLGAVAVRVVPIIAFIGLYDRFAMQSES